MRTSRHGLITIGALLAVLVALLAYPEWLLKNLRRDAYGANSNRAQGAVIELAQIGDEASIRTLCELFEETGDETLRELIRTLLLHHSRMLPTYPPAHAPGGPVEPVLRLGGRLLLLLDGDIPERVQEQLLVALSKRLGLPCVVEPCPVSLAGLPKNDLGAADAEMMINLVARHVVGEVGRVLIVTRRELWATGRPWTPGMAHGFGATAVLSIGALDPTRDGGPEDWERYARRLENVAVQALGHTLLRTDLDCPRAECVMHRVASPAELDALAADFCRICGPLVRDGIRRITYGATAERAPH
ncbi:MAG: hypothetical protein HZA54_16275 [Planctomycetes bacterium]|nr:hypothetical protein [Planctomycetota bacterium]